MAVSDSRTNSRSGCRLAINPSAAVSTQRSMLRIRSLRSAAGRNSEGSTSRAWLSSMRTAMSENLRSPPVRLAIGSCTRLKAILEQRGLDVLDPDLVVGQHARVLVYVLVDRHLVAAALLAASRRAQRDGNSFVEARHRRSSATPRRPSTWPARCARQSQTPAGRCAPPVCSAQASASRALPRSSSNSRLAAPKWPARSLGPSSERDLRGVERQKFLGGRGAELAGQGRELVGPQHHQTAHTARGWFGEPLGAQSQQVLALP